MSSRLRVEFIFDEMRLRNSEKSVYHYIEAKNDDRKFNTSGKLHMSLMRTFGSRFRMEMRCGEVLPASALSMYGECRLGIAIAGGRLGTRCCASSTEVLCFAGRSFARRWRVSSRGTTTIPDVLNLWSSPGQCSGRARTAARRGRCMKLSSAFSDTSDK